METPEGGFAYLDLPPVFELLDQKFFGGSIAAVTLVFLFCVGVCWLLLQHLRAGEELRPHGFELQRDDEQRHRARHRQHR